MIRYHLGWVDAEGVPQFGSAGKALRPTLCLLACESVSGEYRQALPAAAALELVHNYSLIHDDIQDDDRERRHRPTVWAIWGKPQAINVGTAMRILSNTALRRLEEMGIPAGKQSRIQRLLDEASLRLIEGQYLDISYENRFDITANDYLNMIEGKTASLIACALEIGALLGTNEEHLIEGFRNFGWNLGLAFQIRDDILGIWGNQDSTGKPLGSDIRRRKKTLPIVYALEKAHDGLKQELIQIYQNGALDDLSTANVIRILEMMGTQTSTQQMTERYCCEARRIIGELVVKPASRSTFDELINFTEERSF
jgi:geranylgeranyl diphosphate synthase type I